MLDDAGPRGLAVGVVDGGVALEVGLVQQFVFKADRAVFQRAQLVVKVGVDGAGVDDFIRQRIQFRLVFEIIGVQPHRDAVQQVRNHLGVAADGNALVQGVEIVVVKGQAHGQALDNKGGQVFAVAAPLLFGVALDELFVDVAANQGDGLLFQILRLVGDFLALLFDLGGSLLRRHNAPHFVKGVHVEGQRVEFALVVGDRRVRKTVKLCELSNIVPDFFVIGMENMCAILVDIDALNVLSVNVARNVMTLVHDQNRLAMGFDLMSKIAPYRPEPTTR